MRCPSHSSPLSRRNCWHCGRCKAEETRESRVSYIESYYNLVRLHSHLDYLSPIEFEPTRPADSSIKSVRQIAATPFCLFGLMDHSIGETGKRVCAWQSGFDLNRWSTLRQWGAAVGAGKLLPRIITWRRWPEGISLRAGAERAAAGLCSLAPGLSRSPSERSREPRSLHEGVPAEPSPIAAPHEICAPEQKQRVNASVRPRRPNG
jgi:hypothetical protein